MAVLIKENLPSTDDHTNWRPGIMSNDRFKLSKLARTLSLHGQMKAYEMQYITGTMIQTLNSGACITFVPCCRVHIC